MDLVIAVDGPAASGKGTVATQVAQLYRLWHLDTGILYRGVGVLAKDLAGPNASEAEFLATAVGVAEGLEGKGFGDDPIFRTRSAGELASRVAAVPAVRTALLDFQRGFAARAGGAVLDGRDIGTVIAPDAPAKLFVTAAPEVRAERRWKQLRSQGEDVSLDAVLADIALRDARDSGRADAPLIRAADAVLLDTSGLTIVESVDAACGIVEAARARQEQSRSG